MATPEWQLEEWARGDAVETFMEEQLEEWAVEQSLEKLETERKPRREWMKTRLGRRETSAEWDVYSVEYARALKRGVELAQSEWSRLDMGGLHDGEAFDAYDDAYAGIVERAMKAIRGRR